MHPVVLIVFCLAFTLLSPAASASDWLFNAEAGLVRFDNLPRARLPQDQLSESALEFELSADRALPWRAPGMFSVNLWTGADRFQEYSGLNQWRYGVGAGYHHRLGLGQNAPWWGIDTRLGYSDFKDNRRDGGFWQLGVSVGRGWETGFDLRGRIGYERSNGRGGTSGLNPERVFDTERWRASAELDYSPSFNWGIFAGLGFQRGHINTSTTMPGMVMGVWTEDAVFGPGWRTYRVSARVVTFTFGGHIDLGPATQFLVAWERLDGHASSTGADYDSNIYRLRLQHGF